MKILTTILCLILFSIGSIAKTPPEAVLNAFNLKFPTATNTKWSMENDQEWEVDFKNNNVKSSANFTNDGIWIETETEISISDLPANIVTAINQANPGCKIIEADKIENNNSQTLYEADIKSGGKKKEVIYKQDGTTSE